MDHSPNVASLGPHWLRQRIMNGGGSCKTLEDVHKLADSDVGAVVVGSITLEPRAGNDGPVVHQDDYFWLNALGMPNQGAEYYKRVLPEMATRCNYNGKLLIVNVAGMQPEEYGQLAELALEGGADLVELNYGCPNVWGQGGKQKAIPSFDQEAIDLIRDIVKAYIGDATFGEKYSPFSDTQQLAERATSVIAYNVANNARRIAYVATMNTFPNGLAFDDRGQSVIGVGFGGLSGPAIRPMALGQVRQWHNVLKDCPVELRPAIVGVGGISTGRHMLDCLRAGASAVQVTTAYLAEHENPGIFSRILAERLELSDPQP